MPSVIATKDLLEPNGSTVSDDEEPPFSGRPLGSPAASPAGSRRPGTALTPTKMPHGGSPRWTPMSLGSSPAVGHLGSSPAVGHRQRLGAQSARSSAPASPLEPKDPPLGLKAAPQGGRPSSSPLKGPAQKVPLPTGFGPHPWQQQPGTGRLRGTGPTPASAPPQIPVAAGVLGEGRHAGGVLTSSGAHVNDGPRGAPLHLQVRAHKECKDRSCL